MLKFVTPIFLILVSGGLFFSYVDPTYQTVRDLRIENGLYDEALTKSKELREIRDALLSKYNTFTTENATKLEKLLPDNVDNIRLIMEIDNIASKYGAVIRKVDINSGTDGESIGPNTDGYNSIGLNFLIEAGYDDFRKFLDDLSNSLRIVDVTDIEFESSSLNTYRYRLTVKTYWLK